MATGTARVDPHRMDLGGRRHVRQRRIQPIDRHAVQTGCNASPICSIHFCKNPAIENFFAYRIA
jgi:hypothetical protein